MVRTPALYINVLVVAVCGLVYELLAGTLASYVLGDSVTQFSLVIGLYLSAMGVGAWLSGYIDTHPARAFIEVEIAVGLLGGLSAPLLFLSFTKQFWFHPILYAVVFGIGVLVGLELPLLMRILRDHLNFKDLVSRALAIDYIGALVASLLFPLLLVPQLGLIRTSLLFGILNAGIALWGTWALEPLLSRGLTGMRGRAGFVILLLVVGLIKSEYLTSLAEDGLYADPIVFAESSPYQRIVITSSTAGFQLFLNGNLQFSSADEYRYHEALVHPVLSAAVGPRRVLVLGGGDGLALREILRYKSVEHVTLVDLDPAMTGLTKKFPPLANLNGNSFSDPRVTVVNQDAMIWLEASGEPFDAAIVDFPDPNNYALGKLYTTRLYRLLARRLTPNAPVSVQCTSPLFARQSYWCIIRTLEAAGFQVRPYQIAVPSFGVWGFALASRRPVELPSVLPDNLRFLDSATLKAMFVFSVDTGPVPVEINRLDNQSLVHYYESEWKHWN
ncbi:MAG: polyamine aminopropyltransferase [Planctomycetia bacterium]|nr:polyamine aminopropyltransferase [Planctomycetia bacterium]